MLCCLNPDCQSPINPESHIHCQSCGVPLVSLLYNRFKIIKPIGRGGFGKTYLAEDVDNLNSLCVVKQLAYQGQGSWANKKAIELFELEAKQLSLLSENHQIPTLLAYFQDSGYLYLAQQFIEGENLLKQLEQQGQFSEAQIQQLLIELLPVLQFIHDREVIHRDIKPENIMRQAKDGKLFLIDFGVSKLISQTLVGTGSILGSYGYSPLEQLQQGHVVYASDLYALGATCFHLLSGVHPQQLWAERGYGWVNDWRQYISKPFTSPLGSVLDKLLRKDVQNRYQSAKEVLRDLQAPTTLVNSPSPLTSSSIVSQKRSKKKPVLIIGAGVAVAAAIGLAIGIPRIWAHPHLTTPEVVELYNLASDKSDKGKSQEALEDLNNAIALDPNYADSYNKRGEIRYKLGDKNGALEDYNYAITLDSNFAKPYLYRGGIRIESGDIQGAIADFNKVIEVDPGFTDAYIPRGLVRYTSGDTKGSIEDFTKAIELDPKYDIAYSKRGVARADLGDKENASADFNKAIELDPKRADNYIDRAKFRLVSRDIKGAIEDHTKAIELDPNKSSNYHLRGHVRYFYLNDNQGALEDFTKAIELDRNSVTGYNGRGIVQHRLGNLQKALDDFNREIAIKPDEAQAYLNRSSVRSDLGDHQGAIEDNTKAIELDPKRPVAYSNRGVSRFKFGDKKGAIEDFTKAIELKPDYDQAYSNRGEARVALGDKKGAIEDYQKSASLFLKAGRTKDYQDALYRIKLLQKQ
jgi:serine/threonine protein kinase